MLHRVVVCCDVSQNMKFSLPLRNVVYTHGKNGGMPGVGFAFSVEKGKVLCVVGDKESSTL